MRVIAFAGPKGSGKNTAADMVAGLLQARVERDLVRLWRVDYLAFADPMRAAGYAIGLHPEDVADRKGDPCPLLGGRTGRDFLITLGEGVRSLEPNFWANALARRLDGIETMDSTHQVVMVTDLRRENELDALDAWEAARPGRSLARVWIERSAAQADEVLERSVRDRCAVIRNDGTPADLWIRCAALAAWARGEAVTEHPPIGPAPGGGL